MRAARALDAPIPGFATGIFPEGSAQFQKLVGKATSPNIAAVAVGSFDSYDFRTGPDGPFDPDEPLPDDPAVEHFVPPVPPPLPRLQPATKLAWIALFGGPLYLLIATAVGATISGLAAFLAVAAFVGGFVVLVLRMDNGRPPDSGPDDGAVV